MPYRSGSITVAADATTTWRVCADIRRFPEFIAGIDAFEQLPDGRHRWRGKAFGITRTWTSEWVARRPPDLIAWRTDDPMVPDGRVVVEPLGRHRARVSIEMHYQPQTWVDRMLVNRAATYLRLQWDLRAFRRYVERRRGRVRQNVATAAVRRALAAGASKAPSKALSARSSVGREVGSSWHSRQRGS
jgi:uncharacterized membrane protein